MAIVRDGSLEDGTARQGLSGSIPLSLSLFLSAICRRLHNMQRDGYIVDSFLWDRFIILVGAKRMLMDQVRIWRKTKPDLPRQVAVAV